MIDAYTIGITLALEDGVSAGLATIRADLAVLDRTIAGTAAGLLALRRLGQQVSQVGLGDIRPSPSNAPPPARSAPVALTPAPLAAPASEAGTPDSVLSDRGTPARPDRKAPAAPAAMPDAPRPTSVPAIEKQSPVPPPSVHILSAEPPKGKTGESRSRAVSEFAPRQPAPAPRIIPDLPRVGPTVTDAPPVRGPDQQLRNGAFVPEIADVPASAPPPPPPRAVLNPAGPPPVPLVPMAPPSRLIFEQAADPVARPSRISVQTAPLPARPDAPEPPIQPLPVIPASGSTAPTSKRRSVRAPENRSNRWAQDGHDDAQASQRPPRPSDNDSNSNSNTEAAAGGLSGEISLDGLRLGRWMADALARMTERPPSGPTGIDPRAAPGWPTMQGN